MNGSLDNRDKLKHGEDYVMQREIIMLFSTTFFLLQKKEKKRITFPRCKKLMLGKHDFQSSVGMKIDGA